MKSYLLVPLSSKTSSTCSSHMLRLEMLGKWVGGAVCIYCQNSSDFYSDFLSLTFEHHCSQTWGWWIWWRVGHGSRAWHPAQGELSLSWFLSSLFSPQGKSLLVMIWTLTFHLHPLPSLEWKSPDSASSGGPGQHSQLTSWTSWRRPSRGPSTPTSTPGRSSARGPSSARRGYRWVWDYSFKLSHILTISFHDRCGSRIGELVSEKPRRRARPPATTLSASTCPGTTPPTCTWTPDR